MDEHPGSEQELADLLRRAAPPQLPPAGFDHASVLAAAGRAGARRRRAVLGGVAALAVLLGGGAAVAGLRSAPGSDATASSAAAGGGATTASRAAAGSGGVASPPRPPGLSPQLQGVPPCGPVDRTVYDALVMVFPELTAQQPVAVSVDCPAGTTGVGVQLSADGVAGRVEVLVGPAAVTGTRGATGTATTADGRTVTVVPVAADGAPAGPSTGALDDVAHRVAVALG